MLVPNQPPVLNPALIEEMFKYFDEAIEQFTDNQEDFEPEHKTVTELG